MGKKVTKRKKSPFTKRLIPVIVAAVVLYTIAAFILQFAGYEISATLTTCYFTFWGAELISLATIKNSKTKRNVNAYKGDDESEE